MIYFENISKSFNGKWVLNQVSNQFKSNQINLIIGQSGTGKSLLIKCILGLIMPDQGQVFFDHKDLLHGNRFVQSSIKQDIGMLFQGSALFDFKTIEENVRFPLDILTNMSAVEKKERVMECLEQVGLQDVQHKMPSELSGGMKKRAGIARAIINNPKYLFCDEPTSGLDPKTALKIDELISKITYNNNITTVLITHDINTILSLGEFILFLHQGAIIWQGTSKDILDTPLQEIKDFLFVGKFKDLLKKHTDQ